MALSQKRVPTVSDVDTQRAFQQVYDDINEVINAVNQGHTSKDRTSNTGKSGDIRIGKNGLGNHFLELCTDEGWVVSSNSVPSGFISKGDVEDSNDTHILGGKVSIGTTSPNAIITIEGTMSMKEQSDDAAHVAGYSQIWVDDAGNGTLMFTNDAGTKYTVDVTAV